MNESNLRIFFRFATRPRSLHARDQKSHRSRASRREFIFRDFRIHESSLKKKNKKNGGGKAPIFFLTCVLVVARHPSHVSIDIRAPTTSRFFDRCLKSRPTLCSIAKRRRLAIHNERPRHLYNAPTDLRLVIRKCGPYTRESVSSTILFSIFVARDSRYYRLFPALSLPSTFSPNEKNSSVFAPFN